MKLFLGIEARTSRIRGGRAGASELTVWHWKPANVEDYVEGHWRRSDEALCEAHEKQQSPEGDQYSLRSSPAN